jgi:uncharacterized membrane protein (UPF0127 family)/nicotinic acid mononucleotide adenylyltransferase
MKSYKKLKENIFEQAGGRSVVFTFGRFQPPTSGHQLLIDKVVKEAQNRGAENKIYPSHSNDKKQNPLSHKDKVLYMRKMFPKANIVDDPKAKTPFQVLASLEKEGYNNVYMVVGGDRVSEFKTRMTKYADAFDTFEVISAGHRDPDAEGVVGMSGSKMRQAAVDRDFDKFLTGVPEKAPKRISLKLFKSIRKGMGLKEEYVTIGEQTLNVRLADTNEIRARGLMDVKSMSDDDGMFFVFEEENYHGIWMKNTYIPLDVVWINESGIIVDIATLQPHDLNTRMPSQPAKYVLEVNAGTFSGKVGDKIGSVQLDESVELTELTKESRRKMARSARRSAKRRAKKRAIKAKRMKGGADIMKAARRKAMQGFKSKMLKGRSWSALGHQEKEALEKRIKKKYKPARIARVAHKLLPGIRQADRDRIARLKGKDDKNVDEQYTGEIVRGVSPSKLANWGLDHTIFSGFKDDDVVDNINNIMRWVYFPQSGWQLRPDRQALATAMNNDPDNALHYVNSYLSAEEIRLGEQGGDVNEQFRKDVNEITTTQPGFRRKKTLDNIIKTLRVGGHQNTLTPTSGGWTDDGGGGKDKRPPCGPGSLPWNCQGYDLDEPVKGDDDDETSEPVRGSIWNLGVTSDFKNSKVNEQFRLLIEPDILDRLVNQLKTKNPSWSDKKAYAIATASLQNKGVLKKGSHELTDNGKKRNSMGASGRAKDRAAKYSKSNKPSDYEYNKKTNRATLKDERDYRKEYANYQGKPEQVERRSSRNKARRKLEAQGRVRRGDGKDVDHKNRNPLNNGDGNLRVRKKEHNRSFSRKNEGKLPISKDKKQWTDGFWQGKKQALEYGTDRAREDRQHITPGQPVKSFTDIRKKSTR